MCSLEFSLREIYKVKHIGCESEAVAELIEGDASAYEPDVLRLECCEEHKGQARECEAQSHRPEGALKAPARGGDAAEDAAVEETPTETGEIQP